MYGPFTNEQLVGRAIEGRRDRRARDEVRQRPRPERRVPAASTASPTYVRSACEASLQRLGVDTIDLYYQHRVDPQTPIEETVGAMAELVQEGKVRYLGLSEAAPDDPARACRPPDHGAADRVLALEPRSGGRDPADGARARDRVRRLQPARPRLPLGPDPLGGRPGRGTSGGAARASRRRTCAGTSSWSRRSRSWRGEGDDAVAGRPRLGADAGRRHRPDSGDEAGRVSRGERGGGRDRAEPRRTSSSSSARSRSASPQATAIRTCPPSTGDPRRRRPPTTRAPSRWCAPPSPTSSRRRRAFATGRSPSTRGTPRCLGRRGGRCRRRLGARHVPCRRVGRLRERSVAVLPERRRRGIGRRC